MKQEEYFVKYSWVKSLEQTDFLRCFLAAEDEYLMG